jgi:hypothetical protein
MQVPPGQQPPSQQRAPHSTWAPGQHLPAVQVPLAQARPQVPQFRASVWRFTQAVPQVSGLADGQAQAPAWHTWPWMVQAVPQAPQLEASVLVSVQRLAAEQKSGRADGQAQVPPLQIPPLRVHWRPHAPQFT